MAKAAVKKKVEEPAEESAETSAEQKGGKSKLIIIIAAVVFLLIAGGAGTYLYLAHPKEPEKEAQKEDAIPVEAAPILVKVENIVAPLTRQGDVISYVYMDVNLQVADEAMVQEIEDNMPRLRSVIAADLYDRSIADPKAPTRADVSGIQARLLKDAKQVFGADSVSQVYILQVRYYRA
jgi:flagellar basal body-associated protein FliL